MADSKKYDGSQWKHSLRKLTTATEAVENPLYSDGTAITAYTIKGNTVQNGTPTPTNPVEVNGVGVRTENLYNSAETSWELGILDDQGHNTGSTSSHFTKNLTRVSQNTTYFLSGTIHTEQYGHRIYFYDSGKNWISRSALIVNDDGRFTTPSNCAYIQIQVSVDIISTSDWMLNTGSTAKPYEPYGYKIPISSGGVTTNIYLGSTQTTRQIKKLVFGGTENWSVTSDTNQALISLPMPPLMRIVQSSHYIGAVLARSGYTWINATLDRLIVKDDAHTLNVTTWKNYLAAQYAAGTPVTIWYVLVTPETAVVNEPLMKIGDYADTLNNAAQIPTTEGANSITVDTTVQPSEFTATWTGWHNTEVKEKSENLFDGSYTDGYIGGDTGTRYSTSSAAKTAIAKCEPNTTYTIKKITSSNRFTIATSASYPQDSEIVNLLFNSPTETTATITTPADASYLLIYVSTSSEQATPDMMLNTGSTALPYEPYWK